MKIFAVGLDIIVRMSNVQQCSRYNRLDPACVLSLGLRPADHTAEEGMGLVAVGGKHLFYRADGTTGQLDTRTALIE